MIEDPAQASARAESVRRLSAEVASHADRDALGALAFDVLSRQAEGRALFVARDLVEKRAIEHGVERDRARTGAGNLLTILERGPENELERATMLAFAVHGLGVKLAPKDDPALVARFVRHADWLEMATPFSVLPFVDPVLAPPLAERVWRAVAQATLDEGCGPRGAAPASRARNAARLSALAASDAPSARSVLVALVGSAGLDEGTRALARVLAGPGSDGEGVHARGRVVAHRRTGIARWLAWVSGWALCRWLLRGVGFLLGARWMAEVRLDGRDLEIRNELHLLGRVVRSRVQRTALTAVLEARREVRFPALPQLVSVTGLASGLLLGGLVFLDGARSGEFTLALVGAGLALGAGLLDLVLDVLLPGARGQVELELTMARGTRLRLIGVPLADADRLLVALRGRGA